MATGELPIHDIATFVAVAQNASFTRAAERLGTSKSNVGKAVQRLESRLGTKLLQRTTRAVRLTEDGETYLEAARAALDGLNEAETALSARRDEPVGRVRLDVPIGFGRLLLPTLHQVRQQHSRITVELNLSDRQSDPVKDGWDIVVRAGVLPAEGEMTVRKLCDMRLALYASPGYLDSRTPILSVDDFSGHEGIIFRSGAGKTRPWTITDGSRVYDTAPPASVITGDGRAFIDAAIAGMGIAQIFDRVAAPHIRSGELLHVLPQADVDGPPIHALIPAGRRMPPKTRVVLDALVEFFKRPAPQ
jgi:DNA-binding transcriptional LysR family regulator